MIKIKVVSYNNERPSAPMEALFDAETKTLGRSNDNHLVLTDPKHFVSRMQASVRSEGDQHIIVNLSQANALLLNGREIEYQQEQPLRPGDEIQVGLYLLSAEAVRPTQICASAAVAPVLLAAVEPAVTTPAQNSDGAARDVSVAEIAATAPLPSDPPHSKAVNAPVTTLDVPPAFRDKTASAEPQQTDALISAFLKGAGIAPEKMQLNLTPDFMEMLGRLVATSVEGTIDLIKLRGLVKREANADMTMVVVRNNNPLKFLDDRETVLMQMLRKKMPGFMEPVEAMKDAYGDLCAHQLGIVAGMRATISSVLEHLDPDNIDVVASKTSFFGSLVGTNRKADLWESYQKRYLTSMAQFREAESTVFGHAFLKAYEDEVERSRGESVDA